LEILLLIWSLHWNVHRRRKYCSVVHMCRLSGKYPSILNISRTGRLALM